MTWRLGCALPVVLALLCLACTTTVGAPEIVPGRYAAVTDASFTLPINLGIPVPGEDVAVAIEGALVRQLESVEFMDRVPESASPYDAVIVMHLDKGGMRVVDPAERTTADNRDAPDRSRTSPVVRYAIRRGERVVATGDVPLRQLRSVSLDAYSPRMLDDSALEVAHAVARDLQKQLARMSSAAERN